MRKDKANLFVFRMNHPMQPQRPTANDILDINDPDSFKKKLQNKVAPSLRRRLSS
jgi:hypothetical protein